MVVRNGGSLPYAQLFKGRFCDMNGKLRIYFLGFLAACWASALLLSVQPA
jgi:hypothetical protein